MNSKFISNIKHSIFALICVLSTVACSSSNSTNAYDADVIIYGGTSAAITAAVQLVRMDKTVLILCPEKHIGGLSASGLGFTDLGNDIVFLKYCPRAHIF